MDTLKAYEKLRTKFDEDTARVLVDTLAEIARPSFEALATKEDLARLEQVTKADLAATKAELRAEIQAVRTELRVEIQGAKVETIRWVFGAAIGQVIAVIGLVGAVLALTR
jgi:hypothetical protein